MLNLKSWLTCASLMLIGAANCDAQECGSCNGDYSHHQSFGYPSGGSVGGIRGHHQQRKENWEAWKAESAKIYARNDAWPKPFACGDKVAYYSVWNTMINQGYVQNCVLGAGHFHEGTNELNSAGRIKIANIMQNLPVDRRHLLVTRDANEAVSQSRLASVNQLVQSNFGNAQNLMIGLTDLQPSMMSGIQADAISKRQLEGMPVPVIPVASIGSSVSGSTEQ